MALHPVVTVHTQGGGLHLYPGHQPPTPHLHHLTLAQMHCWSALLTKLECTVDQGGVHCYPSWSALLTQLECTADPAGVHC